MRAMGAIWLVLGLLAAAAAGCRSKGSGPVGEAAASTVAGARQQAGERGVWRPRPVAVVVFPGTRFLTPDQGPAALEARLQVLDAMGDPTKAAGKLRFELFPASGAKPEGPRMDRWDAALYTLKDQQTHYDPIIHGYAFRLLLDGPSLPDHPTILRIVFQPTTGPRLTAQAPVRTHW